MTAICSRYVKESEEGGGSDGDGEDCKRVGGTHKHNVRDNALCGPGLEFTVIALGVEELGVLVPDVETVLSLAPSLRVGVVRGQKQVRSDLVVARVATGSNVLDFDKRQVA